MRKTIGIAIALILVLAAVRRFGPALRDRAMAKCQEMFERSARERAPDNELENVVPATVR